MTKKELEKMRDYDLVQMIQNSEINEKDYAYATEVILERYINLIHKNWLILKRQMNNLFDILLLEDEYYSRAYEAFFHSLEKIDLTKVYDKDAWKAIGWARFYVMNARNRLIKEVNSNKIKTIPLEYNINAEEFEDTDRLNAEVENAYWVNEGYKYSPEETLEREENYENYMKVINLCMEKWDDDCKNVYDCVYNKGFTYHQTAKVLGLSPSKVHSKIILIKKDTKNFYEKLGITA